MEVGQIYKDILENLPASVIVADAKGVIYLNKAARDICGDIFNSIPIEELPKKMGIYMADGVTLLPSADFPLIRALKGETITLYEVIKRHEGEPEEKGEWYTIDARPIHDANGNIMAALMFCKNIDMLKAAKAGEETSKQAIKKLEGMYSNIFNYVTLGIVFQDHEGKIIWANPAAERLLGLTFDQMMGLTSIDPRWKAIHEDGSDFPGDTHPIVIARRTGKAVKNVITGVYNPKTEEYVWMNVNAAPLFRDGDSKPFQVYAIFEDITENLNIQRTLQKSEAHYRAVFDTSLFPIVTAGPDMKFLQVNAAFCKLMEYSPDELIGKRGIGDVTHPDDIASSKEMIGKLMRREIDNFIIEKRYVTKSGRNISAIAFVKGMYDKSGHFIGATASILDVTERLKMERSIKESEEMFRKLIDVTYDGIAIHEKGIHIEMNLPYAQMFGYEPSELIGKSNATLVTPESRELSMKHIAEGFDRPYEVVGIKKDGTHFPVEVTGRECDYNGKKVRIAGFKDLTSQRKHEKRIAHLATLLRSIRDVNQLITKEKDRDILLRNACDILVKTRGYSDAWLVLLDENGKLGPIYNADVPNAFRPIVTLIKEGKRANCFERALEKRNVVIARREDPMCAPCPYVKLLSENMAMFIRLEHEKKLLGVLSVTFPAEVYLGEEEQELFKEVADDIAFALHSIHREAIKQCAEDAVRQERDKTQQYLDIVGVIMVAIDTDQRVIMINKKGCDILGYSEGEMLGKNWFDICIPEKVRSEVKRVFGEIISGKSPQIHQYENAILTRNGEERTISWTNTYMRDPNGKIISTLSSGEDITEKKRAEEVLQSKERQLSSIYSNVSEVLFFLSVEPDDRYRFISVNRSFLAVTGLAENQVVGKYVHEVIPEPSLTMILANYKQAIRDNKTVKWEEITPYPAGKKYGEVSVTPLFDKDGHCVNLIGSVYDFTERKMAEEALRESEERYKAIVESAGADIIVIDAEGTVSFINRIAAKKFGSWPDDIIGKNLKEILPGAGFERSISIVKRALDSGKVFIDENRLDLPEGTRWFINSIHPITDPNGTRVRAIVLGQDITERKMAEEREMRIKEMERTTKMKDLFLANMSHELRTPLNAIIGYSEVLSDELYGNLNEKQKEHLDKVLSSSKHLLALISDMLDLTKIEAGMLDIHKSPFDLRLSIKDVRDICKDQIRHKAHNVRVEVPDEIPYVYSDETRVKQILMNLLTNAIKYTPQGGHIHICVDHDDKIFKVTVKDDGPGLTKEDTERVFDLFWQKASTLSKTQGGVGLGLPISKRIVTRLGGDIFFESEPGKGTNVWFTIPVEKFNRDGK